MYPRSIGGTKAGQEVDPLTSGKCPHNVLNLTHSDWATDRSGRPGPTAAARASSGPEGRTGGSAGVPGRTDADRVIGSGSRDRPRGCGGCLMCVVGGGCRGC